MFNFLRNHQAVFHSGYTILCSHQQCMERCSNYCYSLPTLVIFLFFPLNYSYTSGYEIVSHSLPIIFHILHFPLSFQLERAYSSELLPLSYLTISRKPHSPHPLQTKPFYFAGIPSGFLQVIRRSEFQPPPTVF